MARRKLEVLLTGEGKQVRKMFDKSAKSGGKFSRAMGKVGKAAKVAAVGIAAAGGAAIAGGLKVLQMGARFEDLDQKAEAVFEDQLPSVRKWAKENAGAMGLTERRLVGLTANFADLLKPMGFTAEQAAEMAQETNELSGALAKWSGGQKSAAEVSEILSKAMLGEREGLKQLGISITEADVKARLAAKGQEELTGAALEQAKAVATQELIMEKSTDAQDAWADSQDSLTVKLNKGRARLQELKERGIELLLPFVVEASEKMAEWGAVISRRLTPVLQGLQEFVQTSVLPVLRKIGLAFKLLAEGDIWGFAEVVDNIFGNSGRLVTPIRKSVETIQTLFGFIGDVWSTAIGWFGKGEDETTGAVGGIRSFIAEVFPQVVDIITSASEAIFAIIDWVTSIVTKFWDRFGTHIIQFTKGTWENVRQVIDAVLRVIKGIFDVFAGVFTGDWSRAWEGVKAIFSGVWSAIHAILSQAVETIKLILGGALAAVSQLWEAAWNTVKTLAGNAWEAIVGIFRDKIEDTKAEVRQIKDFVTDFFSNARDWLLNAGKKIIDGLIDGIESKIQAVRNTIGKVTDTVGRFLPGSPVKEGPLTKLNRGKAGAEISQMLAEGIAQDDAVRKAMEQLTAAPVPGPTVRGGRVRGGDGAAAAGRVTVQRGAITIEQTFTGNVNADEVHDATEEVVDDALDRLLDELGAT